MEKEEKKVEMDNCVYCKMPTIYPKDTNINDRNYYIEGAGQLCKECYFDIYNNRERKHHTK